MFVKDNMKNQELWQQLDTQCERHLVRWHWVRGHSGDVDNERADQLARDAILTLKAGV